MPWSVISRLYRHNYFVTRLNLSDASSFCATSTCAPLGFLENILEI